MTSPPLPPSVSVMKFLFDLRSACLGLLLLAACQSGAGSEGGSGADAPGLTPTSGQTLTLPDGANLSPGTYLLKPVGEQGRGGAILLEGLRKTTFDLEGVVLRGAPGGTDLDRLSGYGLVLRNCEDVVVRGGQISGYGACVVLENCRGVTLEGMSFDGWYGQRLRSTVASEDAVDWLRPHENDAGEWVGNYGGAISATDCKDLVIRGCRGRKGQNGILLTRVTGSEVYDNDFSFLSGWGLGMYRSSKNKISHNIFDYCVRGYSHGVYWRGQDSAGILMFERCSDNIVAFNSATHGGDGVFLFAGNDLVEGAAAARGEDGEIGGSDRNLFYGNDLRYAVANSLEATFSSENVAVKNRLSGSHQHGVWGGYSSGMAIVNNEIVGTLGAGITIEHGQDCLIGWNRFEGNDQAIELYWDPDPHLVEESYFGQTRDTDSRDHWILNNRFAENDADLVLRETTGVTLSGNEFAADGRPYMAEVSVEGRDSIDDETILSWLAGRNGNLPNGNVAKATLRPWVGTPEGLQSFANMPVPEVPGSQEISAEERGEAKGGLETIVMGEWGPWDFRSGEPRPAQRRPGGLLENVRWEAAWFRWNPETQDPRGDLGVWRALSDRPLISAVVENWINPWGSDEVRAAVGETHFGLRASTTLDLKKAGGYRLSVTSDDGVRVTVDGLDVLEDWTWHAPRRGEVRLDLAAGRHLIELEYFQIDGAQALGIELVFTEE